MSKLYFRYGAMNSGKSTHLLQVAYNYEERGMKVILMKPIVDKKTENTIISRLKMERNVDILIPENESVINLLESYISKNNNVDCILIDEVQFMKAKQMDELFEIAVIKNIPVICYGLRADFKMDGFEASQRLLLIAHTIEELKTICRCGKKGIINSRWINDEMCVEGEKVVIDNDIKVTYESLCGECFIKFRNEIIKKNEMIKSDNN